MPKTTARDPPGANGWTLAHCPPSSEWGPGGNTEEIKAARKGTGHPTSQSGWLMTNILSNRHSRTCGWYMGLTFTSFYHRWPVRKTENSAISPWKNKYSSIANYNNNFPGLHQKVNTSLSSKTADFNAYIVESYQ